MPNNEFLGMDIASEVNKVETALGSIIKFTRGLNNIDDIDIGSIDQSVEKLSKFYKSFRSSVLDMENVVDWKSDLTKEINNLKTQFKGSKSTKIDLDLFSDLTKSVSAQVDSFRGKLEKEIKVATEKALASIGRASGKYKGMDITKEVESLEDAMSSMVGFTKKLAKSKGSDLGPQTKAAKGITKMMNTLENSLGSPQKFKTWQDSTLKQVETWEDQIVNVKMFPDELESFTRSQVDLVKKISALGTKVQDEYKILANPLKKYKEMLDAEIASETKKLTGAEAGILSVIPKEVTSVPKRRLSLTKSEKDILEARYEARTGRVNMGMGMDRPEAEYLKDVANIDDILTEKYQKNVYNSAKKVIDELTSPQTTDTKDLVSKARSKQLDWTMFKPHIDKVKELGGDFMGQLLEESVKAAFTTPWPYLSASSSGKYHPNFAKGVGGLPLHTLAVADLSVDLAKNKGIQTTLGKLDDRETARLITTSVLHDIAKYGVSNESRYTKGGLKGEISHEYLVEPFLEKHGVLDKLNLKSAENMSDFRAIMEAIKGHAGPDTKFVSGEIVDLESAMSKIMHLSDYVVSRSEWNKIPTGAGGLESEEQKGAFLDLQANIKRRLTNLIGGDPSDAVIKASSDYQRALEIHTAHNQNLVEYEALMPGVLGKYVEVLEKNIGHLDKSGSATKSAVEAVEGVKKSYNKFKDSLDTGDSTGIRLGRDALSESIKTSFGKDGPLSNLGDQVTKIGVNLKKPFSDYDQLLNLKRSSELKVFEAEAKVREVARSRITEEPTDRRAKQVFDAFIDPKEQIKPKSPIEVTNEFDKMINEGYRSIKSLTELGKKAYEQAQRDLHNMGQNFFLGKTETGQYGKMLSGGMAGGIFSGIHQARQYGRHLDLSEKYTQFGQSLKASAIPALDVVSRQLKEGALLDPGPAKVLSDQLDQIISKYEQIVQLTGKGLGVKGSKTWSDQLDSIRNTRTELQELWKPLKEDNMAAFLDVPKEKLSSDLGAVQAMVSSLGGRVDEKIRDSIGTIFSQGAEKGEAEFEKFKKKNDLGKSLERARVEAEKVEKSRLAAIEKEHYQNSKQSLMTYMSTVEGEWIRHGSRVSHTMGKLYKNIGSLLGFGYYYTTVNAIRSITNIMGTFEDTLAGIRRVMDRPPDNTGLIEQKLVIEDISNDLLELMVRYGLTIDQVGRMQQEWAKTGYTSRESLKELTEVSSLVLKTGDFTNTADAVKLLNASMTQLGLSYHSAISLVDKWNKLADDQPADLRDFAEAFSRSAKFADNLGISIDQLVALIAIMMERTGRSGREVGTALQSMFSFMTRPKAIEIIEKYGVKIKESEAQFRDFGAVLKDLSRVYAQLGGEEATLYQNEIAMALGMTRRKNFVMALLSGMDEEFESKIRASEEAVAGQYTMTKAEVTMESMGQTLNRLKGYWQALAITLGKSGIIQAIESASESGMAFMDWIIQLEPPIKRLVLGLGGVSIAMKVLGQMSAWTTGKGMTGWTSYLADTKLGGFEKRQAAYEQAKKQLESLYPTSIDLIQSNTKATLTDGKVGEIVARNKAELNSSLEVLNKTLGNYSGSVEMSSKKMEIFSNAAKAARVSTLAWSMAMNVAILGIGLGIGYLATWNSRQEQARQDRLREIQEMKQKNVELVDLMSKQKELEGITSRTRKEESELNEIYYKIAEILPTATTGFDKLGRAKATNLGITKNLTKAEKDLADQMIISEGMRHAASISALKDRKEKLEARLKVLQRQVQLESEVISQPGVHTKYEVDTSRHIIARDSEEIRKLGKELKDVNEKISQYNAAMDILNRKAEPSSAKVLDQAKKQAAATKIIQECFDPSLQADAFSKYLTEASEEATESIEDLGDASGDLTDELVKAGVAAEDLGDTIGGGITTDYQKLKSTSDLITRFSDLKNTSGSLARSIKHKLIALWPELADKQDLSTESLLNFLNVQKEAATTMIENQIAATEETIKNIKDRIDAIKVEQGAVTGLAGAWAMMRSTRDYPAKVSTAEGFRLMRGDEPRDNLKDDLSMLNRMYEDMNKTLDSLYDKLGDVAGFTTELGTGGSGSGGGADKKPFRNFDIYFKLYERDLAKIKNVYELIVAEERNVADNKYRRHEYFDVLTRKMENAASEQEKLKSLNELLNSELGLTRVRISELVPDWSNWMTLTDEQKEKLKELMDEEDRLTQQIRQNTIEIMGSQKKRSDAIKSVAKVYEDIINDQVTLMNKAHDTAMKNFDKEHKATMDKINDELKALDTKEQAISRERALEDHNSRIRDIDRQIDYHKRRVGFDHQDRLFELNESRAEENLGYKRTLEDQELEDKKKHLSDQLEIQEKQYEKQRELMDDHWSKISEIFSGSNLEILTLLAAFDPQYKDVAKGWAEQIIEGFKSGKPIEEIVSMLDTMVTIAQSHMDMARPAVEEFQTGKAQKGFKFSYSIPPSQYTMVGDQATMPARDLANILGASVTYDPNNPTAIKIGGKPARSLDFKDGTNYVGIREVAELLGYSVGWNPDNKVISLKAHTGGYVQRGGPILLRDEERILSPRTTMRFDSLIDALNSVRKPSFGGGNSITQNFYAPLFNSEQTVLDNEVGVSDISENLMAAIQGMAGGRGGRL